MIVKFTSDSVISRLLVLEDEATLLEGTLMQKHSILKAGTYFTGLTELNGMLIQPDTTFPVDIILQHNYTVYSVIKAATDSSFTSETKFVTGQYIASVGEISISSGSYTIIDISDCDESSDCLCPTAPDPCDDSCSCDDSCNESSVCSREISPNNVIKLIGKIVDENKIEREILQENSRLKLKIQRDYFKKIIHRIKNRKNNCSEDISSLIEEYLPNEPSSCEGKRIYQKILRHLEILKKYLNHQNKLQKRNEEFEDNVIKLKKIYDDRKASFDTYPRSQRNNSNFSLNYENSLKEIKKEIYKVLENIKNHDSLIEENDRKIRDLKENIENLRNEIDN